MYKYILRSIFKSFLFTLFLRGVYTSPLAKENGHYGVSFSNKKKNVKKGNMTQLETRVHEKKNREKKKTDVHPFPTSESENKPESSDFCTTKKNEKENSRFLDYVYRTWLSPRHCLYLHDYDYGHA